LNKQKPKESDGRVAVRGAEEAERKGPSVPRRRQSQLWTPVVAYDSAAPHPWTESWEKWLQNWDPRV